MADRTIAEQTRAIVDKYTNARDPGHIQRAEILAAERRGYMMAREKVRQMADDPHRAGDVDAFESWLETETEKCRALAVSLRREGWLGAVKAFRDAGPWSDVDYQGLADLVESKAPEEPTP